ncbi:unnamed protein product [Phaedon cochleariae]|uniref:Endonuclease-reverse transcriptase n=1 Tax=Phaedon cochleariae TaxID=80249 RepID=A0A9P0GHE8_PHACE|nr:unnamed protein product [Phaedon cochleariae]
MEEILKQIKNMESKIDDKLNAMHDDLRNIKLENLQIKKENRDLKQEQMRHQVRIDDIEREIRKKNLIIYGIKEERDNPNENLRKIVKDIASRIEIGINEREDVADISRMGKSIDNKDRPIMVELKSGSLRNEMLREAKKLKGTGVFLSEDFSKHIQEQRKILKEEMKQARQRGHKANLNYNRLYINGDSYTVESLTLNKQMRAGNVAKENIPLDKSRGRKYSERTPELELAESRKVSRTEGRFETPSKN